MAVGLPAGVSRASAEITGLDAGTQVLVGETPDEYADAVCHLLSDQRLAARLSAAAKQFVDAHHTWESKRPLVASVLGMSPGSPASTSEAQ